MSTILKALKKLEQDKQAYQTGTLPAGYMGPGSTHVQSSYRFGPKVRTLVQRCLVLVVILSLTGAAYYFYRQSRNTVIQASNATAPQRRPTSEVVVPKTNQTKSSVKSTAKTIESPPQAITQNRPTAPTSDRTETLSKVSKNPAVDAGAEKIPQLAFPKVNPTTDSRPKAAPTQWQSLKDLTQPEISPEAQPQQNTRLPKPSIVGQQRERTPVSSNPAPELKPSVEKKSVASEDVYDDIVPLADGRLKVQALAWSPIVEDRMAVINTRIVHEGDRVDGFLVLSIRQDDVVVQEKGARYRVIFGRP